MPKRVPPLTARGVASLKRGGELADGALPGLRVRNVSGVLVWSLFVVVPSIGSKKRFEVGRSLTLADARERAGYLRRQVREGRDPSAERQAARLRALAAKQGVGTLEGLVDAYYQNGPGAALRTGVEQKKTIKRVFRNLLPRVASELRRAEVQLRADAYSSNATSSAAVGALRPLLKWAAKRGLVPDDGWHTLERPAIQPGSNAGQRRLSADELRILLPHLVGPYGEASLFILLTAVRLREATQATWAEMKIDDQQGLWTIPAARRKDTRTKRRVKAAPSVDHVIPLPKQAVALLRKIRERDRAQVHEFVFRGAEGGELANWSRWLKKLHEITGIPNWSAHALRRTAATMAAQLGASPYIVQAILGHRSIGGDLQALYQHSRYLPEHALALQNLADHIETIGSATDNTAKFFRLSEFSERDAR